MSPRAKLQEKSVKNRPGEGKLSRSAFLRGAFCAVRPAYVKPGDTRLFNQNFCFSALRRKGTVRVLSGSRGDRSSRSRTEIYPSCLGVRLLRLFPRHACFPVTFAFPLRFASLVRFAYPKRCRDIWAAQGVRGENHSSFPKAQSVRNAFSVFS